jgi:hypothetical protein
LMATDDDKKIPEPDPWAGLDIDRVEETGDDAAFSFDGIGDEAAASDEAAEEDLQHDVPEGEIPLVVFPPPDAEPAGSEIQIGTGQSGIISMADAADNDVADNDAADNFAGMHDLDDGDDAFDDKDIAHELGLLDVDGEAIAAEPLASGDDAESGADFGEPLNEANSDDVSFDAGMLDGASPFADGEQLDHLVDAAESEQDESASIPISAAVAMTGAAAAAAGVRPVAAKKKSSGLGQMVGVVLGGLMALPITYAILLWGFQKDPFKLGQQVPSQLAFLLPQKLQPGYKPPRKADARPSLDAASSLDDLPLADEASPPAASEPAAMAAAETVEGTAAEPAASGEPATTEPIKPEAVAESPAESTEPAPAEPAPKPASEAAAVNLAALPPLDAMAGLDALVADAAVATPAAAAPVAVVPPLDLTGVEMAAERARQAFDAVGAVSDPFSPDRDRLLVTWYKQLARLSDELVRLETTAADSGRPLSPMPAAAADLLDRICVNETAVSDLDRLGGMWLNAQRRRADGISLVVTLGPSRQVGPYWSTRGVVAGAQADGTDRSLSIISRLAPPADTGDRVVVSGVMFEGDAVWAADMRPVAAPPLAEGEQQ